ncbi:MAG: hypothetical protein SAK29_40770 [Scytonema sp. PMC 1069.18]|nr:hypothetical protein [Scytonema sp. PMC 1069.18]MEC4885758.1 hypothetical protein [Scytonema sp. PMC 1070.18]
MSHTIGLTLIAFLVFLGNLGQMSIGCSGLQLLSYKVSGVSGTVDTRGNEGTLTAQFSLSARDERKADCLRAGNCKG